MWVECFLQDVQDKMGDKSNEVLIRVYTCGQEHLIPMTPDRIECMSNGDVVIVADDN